MDNIMQEDIVPIFEESEEDQETEDVEQEEVPPIVAQEEVNFEIDFPKLDFNLEKFKLTDL